MSAVLRVYECTIAKGLTMTEAWRDADWYERGFFVLFLALLIIVSAAVVKYALEWSSPAPTPHFAGAIVEITASCMDANTRAWATAINGVPLSSKRVDVDGMLTCLTDNGVILTLHGDRVVRKD